MQKHVMRRIVSVAVLVSAARKVAAQDSTQTPQRSTLAGVYTAAQAERGRNTYLAFCRSCHSPSEHTEAAFNRWVGHPVSTLFSYLLETMPSNNPGSLDPKDVADVVAYMLRLNAFPTGDAELPADTTALTKIQVELEKKPPPSARQPRVRNR